MWHFSRADFLRSYIFTKALPTAYFKSLYNPNKISKERNVRKKLPFSDETKTMFKALDKECEKLNDNMIDTTHILLVTLLTKSITADLFNEYKINTEYYIIYNSSISFAYILDVGN